MTSSVHQVASEALLLTVNLDKIVRNTRRIVSAFAPRQIVVVTSLACGSPEIARAMLSGGAHVLGEYRLENIERLRSAQISAPIWLMRPPVPSLASDVVHLTDVSLQSELVTVEALERAATTQGRLHRAVALIDLAGLGAGLKPSDVAPFFDLIAPFRHVVLAGVAGGLPDGYGARPLERLDVLIELAKQVRREWGRGMEVVADGDGVCDGRVLLDQMSGASMVVIHEAVLLGSRSRCEGTELDDDAVILHAPVVERPSCSEWTRSPRTHGEFVDDMHRQRRVVICELDLPGLQGSDLLPIQDGAKVVEASGSRLLVDVHDMTRPPSLGALLAFRPNALAARQLFASAYVKKVFESGDWPLICHGVAW